MPISIQESHFSNRAGLKTGFTVLVLATVLALFFSAQMYFSANSLQPNRAPASQPVGWWQVLYWGFGDWYEWALLSPVIFWMCNRFRFDRRSWPKSLAAHIIAGLALCVIHAMLCGGAELLQGWVVGPPAVYGQSLRRLLANRTHYNLAVYALIVCAWHAWDYYHKYREREAHAAELAGRLAQAQLQALRMQLNPHFLFNTLNAVSSLMLKDVVAANRMLSRLGELLRLVLENTEQQEVSLQHEVEFLRKYLEIEKIRFGERLEFKMEIDPATNAVAVPNLILQPLVENAIRHAIEPQESVGRIELRSVRQNGRLSVEISDNGPGLKIGIADASAREHIGLTNTRERLNRLYGTSYQFELVQNSEGGVTARLSIPVRLMMSNEDTNADRR